MIKRWSPLLVVSVLVVFTVVYATAAQAVTTSSVNGDTYIKEISYSLEQPFGGLTEVKSFAQYLQLVYTFALGLVGLLAVVLIMAGGLLWVGAAGNEQQIGQAKEIIISAVTGLIIALLSYTILIFVNPQTVALNFSVQRINPVGNTESIFNYPECTGGTFANSVCVGENNKDTNCKDIACGQKGFLEGSYCRGTVCSEAGTKCTNNPDSPTTSQACQATQCASWIDKCVTSGFQEYKSLGYDDEYAIRQCICGYYNKNILPSFTNIHQVISATDTEESIQSNLQPICGETITQEQWVADLSQSNNKYGYTGTPNGTIWNCGFSCTVARDYSYSYISAGSAYGAPATGVGTSIPVGYSCQASIQ